MERHLCAEQLNLSDPASTIKAARTSTGSLVPPLFPACMQTLTLEAPKSIQQHCNQILLWKSLNRQLPWGIFQQTAASNSAENKLARGFLSNGSALSTSDIPNHASRPDCDSCSFSGFIFPCLMRLQHLILSKIDCSN